MLQCDMPRAFDVFKLTSNATQLEIKQQYKILAMKYHPDRNNGDNKCEQKMKDINIAYNLLKSHIPGAKYRTQTESYTASSGDSYSTFTDFDVYVESIRNDPALNIALYKKELSINPEYKELDPPFPEEIQNTFKHRFYSHQVEIIEHVRAGKDVLIITPTSSGKSVGYMLPFFESVINNPKTTGIFIFPMKALSNDQLDAFRRYNIGTVKRYDGSVSSADKRRIRQNPPNALFTNPDTIHLSLLRTSKQWKEFLGNLKYIVLDEIHTYKGFFGSNVSNILYRLLNVAQKYGSTPQIICTTATIKNGQTFAKTLAWRDFVSIEKSGTGTPEKHFLLLDRARGGSKAPFEIVVEQALRFANSNKKTIVFCNSRLDVDTLTNITGITLEDGQFTQISSAQIAGYHAGYSDEDRRALEKRFKSGDIRILFTSSAMELGIDIGALDVCILYGLPNSNNEIWQRIGRVGRGLNKAALILIVSTGSAIDHYYFTNPHKFVNTRKQPESPIIFPTNEEIRKLHQNCEAFELKTSVEDEQGDDGDCISQLSEYQAYFGIPIRNSWGNDYELIGPNGKVIDTIDYERVFRDFHPGAIYRQGNKYYKEKAQTRESLYNNKIHLEEIKDLDYITNPNITITTKISDIIEEESINICGAKLLIGIGSVEITHEIGSYSKIRLSNPLKTWLVPLKYPERKILTTTAVWISLRNQDGINSWDKVVDDFDSHAFEVLHSVEHLVTRTFIDKGYCDWTDFKGVTIEQHFQFKDTPTIFFYDNCIKGMKIAESFYGQIFDLFNDSYNLLSTCPCRDKCPVCLLIKSYCNQHDLFLNKPNTLRFLKAIANCKSIKRRSVKERITPRPKMEPIKRGEYKVGDRINADLTVIEVTDVEIAAKWSDGDIEYIPLG